LQRERERTTAWKPATIIVAVVFVIALLITWNTAYSSGHSDGVTQANCIQQAQAKALQGLTETQREECVNGPHTYPQC
jgi:hypothetical protein